MILISPLAFGAEQGGGWNQSNRIKGLKRLGKKQTDAGRLFHAIQSPSAPSAKPNCEGETVCVMGA